MKNISFIIIALIVVFWTLNKANTLVFFEKAMSIDSHFISFKRPLSHNNDLHKKAQFNSSFFGNHNSNQFYRSLNRALKIHGIEQESENNFQNQILACPSQTNPVPLLIESHRIKMPNHKKLLPYTYIDRHVI